MYHNNNVETVRRISQKNYSQGFVVINDNSPITLYADSYNKRIKILDNNNLWINTKPIKRKYYTNTKENNNKIKEYGYSIIINVLCVLNLCFKLYNLLFDTIVIDNILDDILETVYENSFQDDIEIYSNNKTSSTPIKFYQDFGYKHEIKEASVNDLPTTNKYSNNQFNILREILKTQSEDNLSLLNKTQNDLDCMKNKVLYYEKIISEYNNIHESTLKDLFKISDILKRRSI